MDNLAAKNSTDVELQIRKAWGYYRLSDEQSLAGDVTGAIADAQQARSVLEPLVAANARNASAAKYLGAVYSQLGKCNTELAAASTTSSDQRLYHWREAKDWLEKSLEIYQE